MLPANAANRLLAEWAPQGGVLMTWPRPDGDFRSAYAIVEHAFAAIAAAISLREYVIIACVDNRHAEKVRRIIKQRGGDPRRLRTWVVCSNDVWTRDHGPLTIITPVGPKLLDCKFNGWGGKYPASHDNALTRTLAAQGAFGATPLESVDFVLEGGSIETDGEGTLLTTSSCLLSPHRNPGFNRAAIEARLSNYLGVERILWIEHGKLAGDDTDGHIDTLARFCSPDTIVYQSCDTHDNEHFDDLAALAQELGALRQAGGAPYRLEPLPWPRSIYDAAGARLPATYANFLIINKAVLVPTYDDPADTQALEILATCFPDREVLGLDCRALIRQFGSLHCATMQLAAGVVS